MKNWNIKKILILLIVVPVIIYGMWQLYKIVSLWIDKKRNPQNYGLEADQGLSDGEKRVDKVKKWFD